MGYTGALSQTSVPVRAGLDARLLAMHQVMLADGRRLDAYDEALARTVQPGDVVVDIGAGSLILSLLAIRHGARRAYAIEADPDMAAIATRLAAENGLADQIRVINGDAQKVHLPELADVLVTEMMGNIGPEEEMAEIVAIAAARMLRPGGRIVPAALTTWVRAISFEEEGWGVWSRNFRGFSLAAVQDHAPPEPQFHFFTRPPVLLGPAVEVSRIRLGRDRSAPMGRYRLPIECAGRLHAVILYFDAELAEGIELCNFPSYPGCNWAVWTWPLRHTEVAPGDLIHVEVIQPPAVRIAADWRLDCRVQRQARP